MEPSTTSTCYLMIDDDNNLVSRSSIAITDTAWHHYVVTKTAGSSNRCVAWIDGIDRSYDLTGTLAWTSGSVALTIGEYNNRAAWVFPSSAYMDEVAVYDYVLTPAQVAAHYAAAQSDAPVWTTPGDATAMSGTPALAFTMPTLASPMFFQMQLDSANTFNTGDLRDLDSSTSQTGWEYWDGSAWTAMTGSGVPSAKGGNEARHTVQTTLSNTTWYRRVRART